MWINHLWTQMVGTHLLYLKSNNMVTTLTSQGWTSLLTFRDSLCCFKRNICIWKFRINKIWSVHSRLSGVRPIMKTWILPLVTTTNMVIGTYIYGFQSQQQRSQTCGLWLAKKVDEHMVENEIVVNAYKANNVYFYKTLWFSHWLWNFFLWFHGFPPRWA